MKRIIPSLLVLALLLPLAACRNEARAEVEAELDFARAENEAKAENKQAPEAGAPEDPGSPAASGPETPEDREAFAAPEKPALAPPKTDWDHILSSEYRIYDNKLYYNLQTYKTIPSPHGVGHNTSGIVMHAYTDLATLESAYLCPDPLCAHDDLNVCFYTDKGSSSPFVIADSRTVYMTREDYSVSDWRVWKADLSNNTVRAVYAPTSHRPAGIEGPDNGVLYVFDSMETTDEESKTTKRTEIMVGLSVESDEVLFRREMPQDCHIHLIRNGKIWYSTTRELIRCDPDFGNPEILFAFAGTGGISAWYYDEYRDEFWFLIVKRGYRSGSVWRIMADGTAEEVIPASKQLIYFQLTNSKIYYSVYDPIKLGEHPFDPNGTVDLSGGKIYAADRDDPQRDARLVYDTHGETFLCLPGVHTYAVFGDQLFFRPALLVDDFDPVTGKLYKVLSIAHDLTMHRIDLTTGEEEIIRFD